MKDLGLFPEEEPKKKMILHKKTSPIITDKPTSEKITLHKKQSVIYEEQVDILLNANPNRMYRSEDIGRERQEISQRLDMLSKKYNRKVDSIVGYSEALLKVMPNMWATQAIEDIASETSWAMLRIIQIQDQNKPKKKLIKKRGSS
jgi:hypothetical protein